MPYAEEIKIKYACALSQLANPDETIEVPSVGDRPPRRLARQTLAEVVEPRYEELFQLIREELRRSGFEELIAAGIVLTGGSAKMEGAIELAEEVFHMPVRLGVPQYVEGSVGRRAQPDSCDRGGIAALRQGSRCKRRRKPLPRGSVLRTAFRSDEGVVSRETFEIRYLSRRSRGMFELMDGYSQIGGHQGGRHRRRRRQRSCAHGPGGTSKVWTSSAPTPTRRR